MNPYQRIPGVQQGHIDTDAKFEQLRAGKSLEGKTVVDLGCNLGRMCVLAKEAGAEAVLGIDERWDYIQDAKKLHDGDGISFECRPIQRLSGNFDVGILSAAYHYIQDPIPVLKHLARCCGELWLDVWTVHPDKLTDYDVRVRSERANIFIPTIHSFVRDTAAAGWNAIIQRKPCETPDASHRVVFQLSNPTRTPPRALLIHGKGGSGKTTYARSHHNRQKLHTDEIHVERWVIGNHCVRSVLGYHESILDRDPAERSDWYRYTLGYINRWIDARINLDLVIEGFGLTDNVLRLNVHKALEKRGYDVTEEEMT